MTPWGVAGRRAPSYADLVRVPVALALLASVLVASPAGAANDEDPRIVERTVAYTCDAGALGGGAFDTTVRVPLPRTTVSGTKLAARPMEFTIVVPDEMTQALRDNGIEEVSAESQDATYSVGQRIRDIQDLVVPPTAVPTEGQLVLEGQGLAQAIRLTRVKSYPVRLPEAFTATVTVTGSTTTDGQLSCVLADGATAKLTSIKVVPARG